MKLVTIFHPVHSIPYNISTVFGKLSTAVHCLCSDIEACTETAGDGALYFARGNEDSLRTALRELLADEKTVLRMREGAADEVLSKYRWNEIAGETLAVYRGE